MAVHSNLDGTRRTEFTVGPDEVQGIRKVGTEIALFDLVAGEVKLSAMGDGPTSIINHLVLNNDGGIVTDNDGEIVVDL